MMKFDLGNVVRRDPDNTQERIHKFVIEHKTVSTLSMIAIGAIFWKLLPLSVFSFLPQWSRRFTVFAVLANLAAWPFARWAYNRLRTLPADVIVVANPAARQKWKSYVYLQGKFTDEFEFKGGRPLTWKDHRGLTVYYITGLDREDKIAWCPDLASYTPDEIMAFEEVWESQKKINDRERRVGAKLRFKSGEIKSKIIGVISNLWIRDLHRVEFQDRVEDEVEELLPTEIDVDDDLHLGNLDDLEAAAEDPKISELISQNVAQDGNESK
jgi:hypothetical protein